MNDSGAKKKNAATADILIIDDDEGMRYTLSRMAEDEGHRTQTAANLTEGLPLATSGVYDVVFLDVRLPDGSGIDIIPKIQAAALPPEIIIITAYGDKNGAQTALRSGVWDYIEKPARINALRLSLKRALQYRGQKKTIASPTVVKRPGIIGSSSKLSMCIELMSQAAKSDANVLINGETGTGKELFARAIHLNSARASGPFVVVDCAALPENLAESILFGHVKGAFTGAEKASMGLIKEADGGTLFLDEVGELPITLQKTFLRVLQEKQFRAVGAREETKSNFRLVSATNRDLDAEVEKSRFRNDLLFRLRTFTIELPALRERTKDIREIAVYHVNAFCRQSGLNEKEISEGFFDMLIRYDWPGNVRELVNTLESATAIEPFCPTLYPKHLPEYIRSHALGRSSQEQETEQLPPTGTPQHSVDTFPTMKQHRQQAVLNAEKRYLQELIRICNGDMDRACEVSGLKRARLYQLMKKYGVSRVQHSNVMEY